ncbi:TlpA family protein disulfide reductase [Magnetospirillum gryphiswaldense]|uniref:Thioredoxin, thioldisulfide interchange protein n=1 Tax=Magnetospirillum gryphiswaldense TaxID=55518 RepID=A4TW94_9PROT|nr:TlpA disulfide reductase family protein [Magnetospirillum gryphiswaldense]AVM73313.1 Thiol:disulfide interchange protein TlpA [Magnetospirillum gryphiswaldense MSR-1]AVM77216.1 Thiol:disulfide interchange protein TlpA [Magnetospirillum gryphiswaldense]CAM74901.1 Thioredoxin, thioldisulfide interchange protein [Magnetospirillum gryphiswaldense MSR-1]
MILSRRHFIATALAASTWPAYAAKVAQGLFITDPAKPLAEIDIRDNQGQPAGVATWRGKPALVNLWASWCLPCVAELPALDRLKPMIEPEGLRVIALCLDRSGAVGAVNTYARLGIKNLFVHVDHERKAGEAFGVAVLPTTLLLDAQAQEVARFVGPAAWDGPESLALLRALIAGKKLEAAMGPPLVKPTANP